MTSTLALLAPLALEATLAAAVPAADEAAATEGAETVGSPRQQQVRIEERVVVRVAPAGRTRTMLSTLQEDDGSSRLRERKIGRCLPLAGISGVRMGGADRLLLVMHDRRLISAQLEKTCRARDFYSGFYVERSSDGRLCIDRDMLLARSGASCSVSRLRQLVEDEE